MRFLLELEQKEAFVDIYMEIRRRWHYRDSAVGIVILLFFELNVRQHALGWTPTIGRTLHCLRLTVIAISLELS